MKERDSFRLILLALICAFSSTIILNRLEKVELPFPVPELTADLLFVEPEDGRLPILERIRGAKKSVLLKCYLLSDSIIIKELLKAKARGVNVRVILEPEPYGESRVNFRTRRRLEEGGIEVKWANPRFPVTHEKSMIIDEKELMVMTMNLCRSAFKKNREYGVLVSKSDVVNEAVRIFEADWNEEYYFPKEPNLVVSPEGAREKITSLIKNAKKRIWIQMLLMEDLEIIMALREAWERGLDVRVLLANPLKVEVNKMAMDLLKGINVRFLYRPFLHAKFINFDGKVCFIGSQNLSKRGLDENREFGLLITSHDDIVRLEEVFERDWSHGVSKY